MPEIDIEKRIEKYWGRKDRQLNLGDEEEFQQMLQEIKEQFTDPNIEHPVKAVDFARWLNPEPLLEVLKPSYPYFKYILERFEPRMRFFTYMLLSRKKNLRQAYNSLTEKEYKLLGFTEGKPTYEILREFIYERIGIERFPEVFEEILKELVFLLHRKNMPLGKSVFQDATDIQSLKHDAEAKYSGYYKHSGYKLDVTLDAEMDIPLCYTPMEITYDEGKNLVPSQKQLATLGLHEVERVVDDKYATFENIAHSEINKVSLFYKIAKNWVSKKESKPQKIKGLYQKYHSESDFVTGADMEYMLQYLYKKGEFESVGGFFRNRRMKENDSAGYQEKCKKRGSYMEGFFGRVKNTTLLDDRPCKRGWKGLLFRAGTSMLTLVFAALIRVQNGIFENLTNVTYIT
ncbi:MAG: hypothetical protein V1769_02945 [Thermoplasmatota archaeon]